MFPVVLASPTANLQEAVIEKFVKYYKAIFHHNTWYFANFVMCECLNFALLFVQFQLTDNFLNRKFRWWVTSDTFCFGGLGV